MKRREFLRKAAAGWATLGTARSGRVPLLLHAFDHPPPTNTGPSPGGSDRSPGRNPRTLQRSTIVVEGLVAGGIRKSHLESQKIGGVDCGVFGMPADFGSFSALLHFLDEDKSQYCLARSVAEIRRAKQDGKISQVYGWQLAQALGSDFNNPLGSTATSLRAYYEMGLRIVGIAYNVTNVFGGGCLEPHVGLTKAGRRLVEEIHGLRILLDVGGHTGEQASFDALAISSGVPVICSHTNVATIADNPRCISDRLIEAIAGTGGVIGLTAVSDFIKRGRNDFKIPVSPLATLDDYLAQFDYVRKLVGVDHIGLGPDFIDGIPINFAAINHEILPPQMISEGTWRYVDGFDNISKLPSVTAGLIGRGWSTDDIRKVLGENWLRVYQQAWAA